MSQKIHSTSVRIYQISALLLAIGLLLYVGYRTIHLSFTHDESYSFTRYIDLTFNQVIAYQHPVIPNNHILNTLLMQLMHWVVGPDTWAMRLPNWVALGAFLLATHLALCTLASPSIRLSGFVLITANVYLMDFFGLARGYGLAIACMMWSLYQWLEFVRTNQARYWYVALGTATLAVVANFTFLNFFLSLIGAYNLRLWLVYPPLRDTFPNRRQYLWHYNRMTILNIVLLGAFLYEPMRRIIQSKTLFGGETGFWTDTVQTLIDSYLYYQPWTWADVGLQLLVGLTALGLLLSITLVFWRPFRNRQSGLKELPAIAMVLWLMVLSVISQHVLLGTQYITHRTALLYVPIFFLAFAYGADRIAQNFRYPMVPTVTVGLLAVLAMFGFGHNYNLTHTADWTYDAQNEAIIRDITKYTYSADPKEVQVGITWLFEPSLNYYRRAWHLTWLDSLTRDRYDSVVYDYFLLLPDERNPVRTGDTVQHYPISQATLYKAP